MKKAWIVFLLTLSALPLRAGLSVGGTSLRGEHGYQERSVDAELRISPKFGWDDPDIPQPFTAFSFRLGRTGYKREGVAGASYTTHGGAGATLFEHATLDFDYARTPELSESSGSYRSRAWTLAASGWWEGWVPDIDVTRGPSALETRVGGNIGRTNHEEHIQISTQPVQWHDIAEDIIGLNLAQTYWKITTLRFFGNYHSYDRDIKQSAKRLELFPLAGTRAASRYDLLQGFAHRDWGAGLSQYIGQHLMLGADWSRTSYEVGNTPRSDTVVFSGSIFIGLYVTLNARYETFKPLQQPKTRYSGFGIGIGF